MECQFCLFEKGKQKEKPMGICGKHAGIIMQFFKIYKKAEEADNKFKKSVNISMKHIIDFMKRHPIKLGKKPDKQKAVKTTKTASTKRKK